MLDGEWHNAQTVWGFPISISRIPFIEARIFDPDETQSQIEHRLLAHLRKLREGRLMALKGDPDPE